MKICGWQTHSCCYCLRDLLVELLLIVGLAALTMWIVTVLLVALLEYQHYNPTSLPMQNILTNPETQCLSWSFHSSFLHLPIWIMEHCSYTCKHAYIATCVYL